MPKFYIIKYQRFKISSKNKVSKNWTVSVKKLDSEVLRIINFISLELMKLLL